MGWLRILLDLRVGDLVFNLRASYRDETEAIAAVTAEDRSDTWGYWDERRAPWRCRSDWPLRYLPPPTPSSDPTRLAVPSV